MHLSKQRPPTMQITNESNVSNFSIIPHIVLEWPGISLAAFKLYCYYVMICGNESGTCWTSIETSTGGCGMSKPTIIAARKLLENIGLIAVCKKGGSGGATIHVTLVNIWNENSVHIPHHKQPETVKNLYPHGKEPLLSPVKNLYTKKNPLRRTKNNTSGLRNPDSASEDFGLTKKKNNQDSTPKLDKF